MKNFSDFKKQLLKEAEAVEKDSAKEVEPELEPVEPEEPVEPDVADSSRGELTKIKSGWSVQFVSKNTEYVLSLSPLDDAEKHWKFIYYKKGQRDSSDINKFGPMLEWKDVWEIIIAILKDFIKLFRPDTIKFIGMSISKRGSHYKHLFKMITKYHRSAFRKQNYITSFDSADLSSAPSFVIRKHISSEAPKKSNEK
jgi:hypothetical protein